MGFCIPLRSRMLRRGSRKSSSIISRRPTPKKRNIVTELEDRIKKNSYVESTNNGNILLDSIFVSTMQVELLFDSLINDSTDYEAKDLLNVTYNIKPVTVPDIKLDSILDRDGNFRPTNCYMIKLKHRDGFTKGALYLGHSAGFTATICLKNDGVSGIYIPGTSVIRSNICQGDTIVSRSSRGVQFLPQIGGDAIYLIVSLCPTKKLIDSGFSIPEISSNECAKIAARILSEKRKEIIMHIDTLVQYRVQLESTYYNSCMLLEFLHYCNSYSNIINESLLKETIQKDINITHTNITTLLNEITKTIKLVKSLVDKEDIELVNNFITKEIKSYGGVKNRDVIVNSLCLANLDFHL
ncbi:rhoa signaling inhibitor [Skunkpox virus]|uniref:Protein OPG055 n=1 Tax=Skunkpox virus TaxID=160796 RepID=A0A1C9KBN1_9POXV|nr:rhoa signaling inhibitor [Skunkpox virus]AOP31526.1 rhoa signaling inhibitor [Skunkpox virus]